MANPLTVLLQGAIVVALFAGASLVAAGVVAILGTQVMRMDDGIGRALAMTAVGLLAVACALIFIKGGIRQIAEHLQYRGRRRGG